MRTVTWRAYLIFFLLFFLLAILLLRLFELSLIDRRFLLQQSDARILRTVTLPAHRGMIMDRTGSVLAISSPVYSVWINPKTFHPTYAQLHALSRALQLPPAWIEKTDLKSQKKTFVYLKRQNSPDVKDKIEALNISGLHFETQYQRFYPEGEVTAHVLGMTNVDDHGQEGLELAYDHWLQGSVGKNQVLKDRLGRVIANVASIKEPNPGRDLTLSIDHRIQYIAYRALKEQVEKYHAKAGSVVVMNPKTGEILAMVNQPSYNPNGDRAIDLKANFRNRAITDSFEPGSTMKPFTIALALESGKYKPTSLVNTHPGYMHIGGYDIRDDFRDNGIINLQKILQVSSNVGAAKILLSLSPEKFWHLLQTMGFGARTSSGFPGESPGRMLSHPVWYSSDVATLAYGYGIAVTTLQLAHAYSILADGGIRYPVSFLKIDNAPQGARVINPAIANSVVRMLETVIQKGGTGTQAAVPGYRVAGKTGTAYIADATGYNKKKYVASFVGMAPASNPALVIAINIRDPQGAHFGGEVSAPVFSKIMSRALRTLNVPPDDLK